MGDLDGTQVSTKRRGSRPANKKNEGHAPALSYPADDDKDGWKAYWKAQGQTWRTEPLINDERQKYLAVRRRISPGIEKSIFPFKGIKLSRADIEWQLATHEDGIGPIDWSDERQRNREGLDLRGADLRDADLMGLPLAGLVGGIDMNMVWKYPDMKIREGASIHLEKANLVEAHLERANLYLANLEGVDLSFASLEGANLSYANLEESSFANADLKGSILAGARLIATDLDSAHLERADLDVADLTASNLNNVFFDRETNLGKITLGNGKDGFASLADVHWGDVNVAVVDWSTVTILGDEQDANGGFEEYQPAARAYRQLAIVLQNQGLSEDAARFAYRAQLMQREVFRQQRKFWRYFGSLFLDLLAGYGHKWWRSFIAYLIVLTAFATVYFIIGRTIGPALSPLGAWVFSMTSFHGRGFFPGGIQLDDPLTVLAALEAFVGLLIEVMFIATLTRRFFGE